MSSEEDINPETSPESPRKESAYFEHTSQPKIIRVLTVLAYILSVSMAAILLSIYYIFVWSEQNDQEVSSYFEYDSENATQEGSFQEVNDEKQRQSVSVACGDFLQRVLAKMSYKISLKNGINCTEAQWIKTSNPVDASVVKLAGEEAKDRLYEPKHKKKLVRVLTVIAYVFFVSLAAIMLSLYYVFLWNGEQKSLPKYAAQAGPRVKCDDVVAEMQQQITEIKEEVFTTSPSTIDENTTSPDYDY